MQGMVLCHVGLEWISYVSNFSNVYYNVMFLVDYIMYQSNITLHAPILKGVYMKTYDLWQDIITFILSKL